ncbi:TetR/AcrR family transcriptional regulator [Streptomyces sp. NPDC046909]|uniref:TetR/AcrR family transcriptional regulator n=1 Tax=Streptomyces sp. NPDC046909 TaxID=3155617 RepID=UPI0033C24150
MQVRAARTREILIRGAAECMDTEGYRGATLTAISKLCNVSIGALTFHFPDKTSLAAAVVRAGAATARTALEATPAPDQGPEPDDPDSALRAVGALLHALTELIERDVVVRVAALLARERADIAADWHEAWLPRLVELAERADARGELAPGAEPRLVAGLVGWLLAAAEAYPRTASGRHTDFRGEVARAWPLIERGIARSAV